MNFELLYLTMYILYTNMILTIRITLMAIVGLVTFFTFRKREEVPRNPRNPRDWCKSCSIMPDGRRICL